MDKDGTLTYFSIDEKEIRLCDRQDYERVEWGENYYDGLSAYFDYCYDNLNTSKLE